MLFQGKKINCIIAYNNNKYSFELERHKTMNDLMNVFTSKIVDKNYPFLVLQNINNKLIEIKNLDTTLLSLIIDKNDHLLFQFVKSFKCPCCSSICDNKKKYIKNYCLNCNKYMCSDCSNKKDSKHNSHDLININQNNLKESIKLWHISLNADLSNLITSFNRQFDFINDKGSDIKIDTWMENIFKKIKDYENILIDIKNKCLELKPIIKETEDILNKAMSNLTKAEQEINSDFFNNDKISNKYFTFFDAENEIQKLKDNYLEIKSIKGKLNDIIDVNNIKAYDEILYNIPKSFEDLSKVSLLILEDLKTFETKVPKFGIDKKDKSRKINDLILTNNTLFRTANDSSNNKTKNKNFHKIRDGEKKKTDISLKIPKVLYSENNEEKDNINYNFKDSDKKLLIIKNMKDNPDSRRKSSDIKVLKNNNNIINGTDPLRYTPKNLKLPKIIMNNEKEKNNNIFYNHHYTTDLKRSAQFQKLSSTSKNLIK